MFVYKVDDNIKLRLFNLQDTKELHELTIKSKDTLRKWLSWVDYNVKDINNTEKYIRKSLETFSESGGYPSGIAIIYKSNIAGTICFNEINRSNKYCIIGYWLGDEFQGKGIMIKTVKAIIDITFNEFKLNRIEFRIASENEKSKKIPIKLGFKEEGKIRQGGFLYDHYVDLIIYGILAEEWCKEITN